MSAAIASKEVGNCLLNYKILDTSWYVNGIVYLVKFFNVQKETLKLLLTSLIVS